MRASPFLNCLILVFLLSACSNEMPVVEQPPLVRAFTVGGPSAQEAKAVPGTVPGTVPSAPGPIRTSASQAFAEVSGEVLEVLVSAGARVNAGQALVRIDPRDIRLADSSASVQVQAARAELAAAESDFSRYTDLKDQRFISQAEWERRRAALESTRARFEATLDQLGVSTVRALDSAAVVAIAVQAGQPVRAGQLLARLKPDRPERMAAHQAGSDRRDHAMLIPLTAVIDGQAVMKLVRPDGNGYQVQRQAVRLGQVKDGEVQILEGLSMGDRIVAVGAHLLTAGQAVRLSQSQER